MIYLLQTTGLIPDTPDNGVTTLLKIGWMNDSMFYQKLSGVLIHNPFFKLICTIPGATMEDSQRLHYRFKEFQWEKSWREWYIWTPEIPDFLLGHLTVTGLREVLPPLPSVVRDEWVGKVKGIIKSGRCSEEVEDLLTRILLGRESRMKLFCEARITEEERDWLLSEILPEHIFHYYTSLGPERCRACGYNPTRMDRELETITLFDKSLVTSEVYGIFKVGSRYTKTDIKQTLKRIYSETGYGRTPKATDLKDWFEVQDIKMMIHGKYEHGFRILRLRK